MCDFFFQQCRMWTWTPLLVWSLDSYSTWHCFLLLYEPRDVHHRLLLWTCTSPASAPAPWCHHHQKYNCSINFGARENPKSWTLDLKTQLNFNSGFENPDQFHFFGAQTSDIWNSKTKTTPTRRFKLQAWWRQIFRKPKASFWWLAKPRHKLP